MCRAVCISRTALLSTLSLESAILTDLNTVVTVCNTTCLALRCCVLVTKCVCVCFILLSHLTVIIFLHSISRLVFVMETDCVLREVRTEVLNIILLKYSRQGRQSPFSYLRGPAPSQFSLCEFCGEKSATVTGFSPSTSVFPWQYHSTNAPNSYFS